MTFINKENIEDILKLTPLQEGLLFHNNIQDENSDEYFVQLCLTIKGSIDTENFEDAWNKVIKQNEMLRTVYKWEKLHRPVQIVLKENPVNIIKYDITDEIDKSGKLEEIKKIDKLKGFDITNVPFRITLVKEDENKYNIIISNHHIIYDGWSTGIILNEFLYFYNNHDDILAPKRKSKFKQYLKHLNESDTTDHKQFWQHYLDNFNNPTYISNITNSITEYKPNNFNYKIPEKFSEEIKLFINENKITLSSLLYTAWGVLLSRYSNSDDVVFGGTVSGRNVPIDDIDNTVGLFINTLPIRVKTDTLSIRELLKSVNNHMQEREKYEITSLVDIKKYSGVDTSLFDSVVVIENYPLDNILKNDASELQIENYTIFERTNYNLTVGIETFEGITINLLYNKMVFAKEFINNLLLNYIQTIKNIMNHADKKSCDIDIVNEKEANNLLTMYNKCSYHQYEENITLHELFEKQVSCSEERVALKIDRKTITYKNLNIKANQLARQLRKNGVKQNIVVALLIERSIDMIIAILAVLKAGGAYLPIDTQNPSDRVDYIIEDSSASLLLKTSNIDYTHDKINTVLVDAEQYYKNIPEENLTKINSKDDLAYIIYTSGSTGMPKGVMIQHKSITSSITWRIDEYEHSKEDTVLQIFSYVFDGFLTSFFTPLLSGVKIVLLNESDAKNPVAIKKSIRKNSITHFIAVPTLYTAILEQSNKEDLKSLKSVTLAGEAIKKQLVKKSKTINKNIELINEYGPTEASVVATIAREIDTHNITIGKPIANKKIYILNQNSKLQPTNVYGEICIGGAGLAKGYVSRPQLTSDKFIKNPYIQSETIYKTGDIGKIMIDGNIMIGGRIDHQVKIRGYRIELEAIESRLLEIDHINKAVVLVKEKDKDKFLCAYLSTYKNLKKQDIRYHLKDKLPKYMIPTGYVFVDKMPTLSSGKINTKVLSDMNVEIQTINDYKPPINEIQMKLTNIYNEILGTDNKIGINDDFFEIGGHSLNATYLISKIHKDFNTKLHIKELYKNATIEKLSKLVHNSEVKEYKKIEEAEKNNFYPLSSLQKRLFILNQLNSNSTFYNMSTALNLKGELDIKKFKNVFKKLISRHESLRTSFKVIDDSVVQIIHDDIKFDLDYIESRKDINNVVKKSIKPFDLSKAPLINVTLIKVTDEEHVLTINMHHIISDGGSTEILISEFLRLYSGQELEDMTIQYKDYSVWQQRMLLDGEITKQEEYWLKQLKNFTLLDIKTDYQRSTVQSYEGDSLEFKIKGRLTKALKEYTKENKLTMYMVLLGAFNILLSKYSRQDDIVVGTPISIRQSEDLKNVIGMFANTLVMRNKPSRGKTIKEFMAEVKENSLNAYANRDYQFDDLVEKLGIIREASRNPIFDVMFSMPNVDIETVNIDGISVTPYTLDNKISKFDILLTIVETISELKCSIEYRLYRKETIELLANHYINILQCIVYNQSKTIDEINMLSESEKHKIIDVFNKTNNYYPKSMTIKKMFEEQVADSPDSIAVVYKEEKITYRELNEKANRLARYLRELTEEKNQLIGLMAEKSLEKIIALIAISKAGCAFVGIAPEFPKDRIKYMLENSNVDIVLTHFYLFNKISFDNKKVLCLEDETIYSKASHNLKSISGQNDLMYVIYTSGSTGKPKGIMIEQRTIINLLFWEKNRTNIDFTKKILQFANISFDICFQEVYSTLLNGGELHVITNDIKKDAHRLLRYIKQNKLSTIFLPTSYLKYIMSEEALVKKLSAELDNIIVAGEQLIINERFKNFLIENKITLHNHYGPSEAHVVTAKVINPIDKIKTKPSIGMPVSNTKIYILDENDNLSPIGVRGELCIAGDGVARGYLNNEELTKQKFIMNPFDKETVLYRTGDLAAWLPDGNIEFIGRIDKQVKIRGYRVELSEIETIIKKNDRVKDAIVIAKDHQDMFKYLCAYIVIEQDISISEIKEYLLTSIPEYMVPSYFIRIDAIPLNANGKVDEKKLPEPKGNVEINEYEAPRNETENQLVDIIKEILNIEQNIGINDKFFDIGGNSLTAVSYVSKIHQKLNKTIELNDIFKRQTVKELAVAISKVDVGLYREIDKVEEREYYPLSSPQMRMYILNQYNDKSINYNMPSVLKLKGRLDKEKLENVFKILTKRHESLRTSFKIIDKEPVFIINDRVSFTIEYFENIEDIDSVINKFIRPFDLSNESLIRVGLICIDETTNILILDMHHIISDGVSAGILVDEFIKLYNNEELIPLKLRYKDYAVYQRRLKNNEYMLRQEKYWLEKFSDGVPTLDLITDYKRPKLQSLKGDYILFDTGIKLAEDITRLAKRENVTLYMILLTAYNTLLYRYTNNEDIVVGMPIAGRSHADLKSVVGMFVNTLALRNQPKGSKSFIDFLTEVKENIIDAIKNQDFQFEELVDKLRLDKDLSRATLFDTVLSLQNMSIDLRGIEDLEIIQYEFENKTSKFDISIDVVEKEDNIKFRLQYCTDLFKQDTIIRLSKHFINILNEVCSNPEIKLKDIDLISEDEKKNILALLDNKRVSYPKKITIHELFEKQAQKHPRKIAVVCGIDTLTYNELNKKSNRLARLIKTRISKKDAIVGIMLERSTDMIVAILAVLKSGGGYLPIDTSFPNSRIEFMLEDSNAELLVTAKSVDVNNLKKLIETLYIKEANNQEIDCSNLNEQIRQSNLAYIIYTSGTTGRPKGVMIEHKNVVRLLFNDRNLYDFNDKDVWTMFHSYCFDFSVWEMYGALLYGGKLIIVPKETAVDPNYFLELLQTHKVTVLNQTPSAFYNLIDTDEKQPTKDLVLRYVIFGGEVLNPSKLDTFNKRYSEVQLINMYGITETTVHVTYKEITREDIEKGISNIGKPIPTLSSYVMDEHMNLQPIGASGELCVGGEGVARGYINRKELNASKFIDNPYMINTKMYKSGDLVRLLDSGDLEYLGRIDKQIKIRGYRIELAEIQSILLKHKDIKTAIIITKEIKSETSICAYLQFKKSMTINNIKEYLLKYLPEYMMPTYYVELEKIPLTNNGKIDYGKLPESSITIGTGSLYEKARNQTDRELISLYKAVLGGKADININDSFFDLGGHSLKATTLIAYINKQLNVNVPLKQIFITPTIKGLSDYIQNSNKSRYRNIKKATLNNYYPISSPQKRMYLFNQMNSSQTNYNMPCVLELKGKIDLENLSKAFKVLVNRHESLRTSFLQVGGEIVQKTHDNVEFEVVFNEVKDLDKAIKTFIRPFNLSIAPLIRASVIKTKQDKYYLLTDMHHIISDGVSTVILIRDFASIYNGDELQIPVLTYKDYAIWQNEFTRTIQFRRQKEYWLKQLSGELPILDLMTDYERPEVQNFLGDSIDFTIDKDRLKKLYDIAESSTSTLFMVIMAVYNTLLYKYTGQDDIIVASPIAGRAHADLQDIIGIFLNTLIFRNKPAGDKTFRVFLNDVKKTCLDAYENQDYQLEDLIEDLKIKRDRSRNPLFDTMFNLRNMGELNIKLDDLEISTYKIKAETTKLDIELAGFEQNDELIFTLEYRQDLFKTETMQRLVNDFIKIIDIVTNDIDIKLADIEVVSYKQKQDIIEDFNDDLDDLF
ncbi:amino acid adenylation domain-containing protein [Clostridiaceae bacterium M8S5]|nr:amino acid adenylation domain-containing protein [Clostridiaceae bacterium M8S5]